MTPIIIERIRNTDPAYREMVELRDEVLRRPLGLSIHNDDLSKDNDALLFLAREDGAPVGCVILVPLSDTVAKLRAMAVRGALQGRGIGALLVRELERTARELGHEVIELHARITAQRFYERLGYRAEGEIFTEVTVPHIRMKKYLS